MAKLKDYQPSSIYPFSEEVKCEVVKNISGIKVDSKTPFEGITKVNCDFYKWTAKTTYALRDKSKFIKVYKDALKMILELSSTAQKILWYVMNLLEKKQQIVKIDTNECMEACCFKTRKSVIDGICELLQKNVLCRSDKAMKYWVNPIVIFNGSRLQFIREFILEQNENK